MGGGLSSVRVAPGGSMFQELPFNWMSFEPMPVIPVPNMHGKGPLLRQPTQSTTSQSNTKTNTVPQPQANPSRQFDPKQEPTKKDDKEEDSYIYRGGNFTDGNFYTTAR